MKSQKYTSLRKESVPNDVGRIHFFVSKNSYQVYLIISVLLMIASGFAFARNLYELAILIALVILGMWGYAFSGIAVDTEKKRYKNFAWVLGLKIGIWYSLEEYPDLILLRRKKSIGTGNFGLGTNYIGDGLEGEAVVHYELYFASPNHFDKISICKYSGKEKAYEDVHILETKMGSELVQYNPGMRNPRKKLS